MRILVLDHNAVDTLSQSLYRHMSSDGEITVRILVPDRWFDNYRMTHAVPSQASGGCEVIPLSVWFPTRTHRLLYRGIARQIREFRPDVFYVNAEPENFQTLQCALLSGRHTGVRFLFSTWRNIDYSGGVFPYRFSRLHAFAERFVLRRADHAVAFVAEALGIFSRLGFDRLTWIPPEVDTAVFTPSLTGKSDRGGVFTVGYAGRLHPLKGVDLLLDAIAGLPADFRLVVVGAGPEEARLRTRCTSLGLENRVTWRPPVPRGRMPELLNEMDVLVLPSRTGRYWKEQFGRVLVEAMACGIPVIGSDSGAIPAVIGDAGQVVPESDVPALRDALLKLRNDPLLRQEYIRKGLSRVSQRYAVPVVASRYLRLMRSVAGGSARSLDI
jgi:glycosyltransferase involved in cell wall biosynthesis